MVDEILEKAGLFIDSFYKIRLTQPELAESSEELIDGAKEFINNISTLSLQTEKLIDALIELEQMVESEKIHAMAMQNYVKKIDKQKTAENEQLEILIREREIELERLRVELEAAQRVESTQKHYLEKLQSPS